MVRTALYSVATRRRLSTVVAVLALATSAFGESNPDDAQTQKIMHQAFGALTEVLPLSVDLKTFRDDAHRTRILASLKTLNSAALKLERHFSSENQDALTQLSLDLAKDASDAYVKYRQGLFSHAQFIIHNMTSECVSCHSRLPAKANFDGGKALLTSKAAKQLTAFDRAVLLTVTRQFDDALSLYEELLKEQSIQDLLIEDAFNRYLKLTLRVHRSPARAKKGIKVFAARDDLPSFLAKKAENWIEALDKISTHRWLQGQPSIMVVRRLMDEARRAGIDNEGQDVYYTSASGLLVELIPNTSDRTRRSELYLLLGKCEASIGNDFWAPQTRYYLESAIRAAPKSPYATQAFIALEHQVLLSHSGPDGSMVPDEQLRWLNDLRRLVDAS